MGEIIARRQFDPLYIWLDIIFLLIFMGLLLYKKKFTTVVVGLIFGLVYMAVDYGIFHPLCHARSIEKRLQPFLGSAVDVNELWFYQFYMDMAVAFQG